MEISDKIAFNVVFGHYINLVTLIKENKYYTTCIGTGKTGYKNLRKNKEFAKKIKWSRNYKFILARYYLSKCSERERKLILKNRKFKGYTHVIEFMLRTIKNKQKT